MAVMGAGAELSPHRFTREEYDRMVEAGALEDLHVELLDGEIVDMGPQGAEHVTLIRAFTCWFGERLDLLAVQLPIAATDDSEPEPDVALLEEAGSTALPRTALLVVEVVVTQRAAALRKAAIYARARVPEYWIVDVPSRTVTVLSSPGHDAYAESRTLRGDDVLAPPAGISQRTVAELLAR